MTVMDVYGKEGWQALLDELQQKLNLPVKLLDQEAKGILQSGEPTALCEKLREKPENRTFICAQTAQAMTAEIKATGKPVNDFCEAGLARFAVPVIRGGEFLGQVTGCGAVTDPGEMDAFALSRQMGIGEPEAEAHIEKAPRADKAFIAGAVQELWEKVKEA